MLCRPVLAGRLRLSTSGPASCRCGRPPECCPCLSARLATAAGAGLGDALAGAGLAPSVFVAAAGFGAAAGLRRRCRAVGFLFGARRGQHIRNAGARTAGRFFHRRLGRCRFAFGRRLALGGRLLRCVGGCLGRSTGGRCLRRIGALIGICFARRGQNLGHGEFLFIRHAQSPLGLTYPSKSSRGSHSEHVSRLGPQSPRCPLSACRACRYEDCDIFHDLPQVVTYAAYPCQPTPSSGSMTLSRAAVPRACRVVRPSRYNGLRRWPSRCQGQRLRTVAKVGQRPFEPLK